MKTGDIYKGRDLAIIYAYVREVRFKGGRRSVTDNLNKSEMKVTGCRQSRKKDATCLSLRILFAYYKLSKHKVKARLQYANLRRAFLKIPLQDCITFP